MKDTSFSTYYITKIIEKIIQLDILQIGITENLLRCESSWNNYKVHVHVRELKIKKGIRLFSILLSKLP